MFDRYYCINSAKLFYNLFTFSYASTLLKTMHDLGPVQILIIVHVLSGQLFICTSLVVKKKPSVEKSSDEKVNDDSSSIDYSHHSSVKNFQ